MLSGFLIGVGASAIATFAHADRTRVGNQMIYFGLALAPAFLLATQRWVMSYYRNRVSGIMFALAWLVVTIRLAVPNSDGDLGLGATWYSTAYLGITALLLSMSSVIKPRTKLSVATEN